jgi:hypothetical protein
MASSCDITALEASRGQRSEPGSRRGRWGGGGGKGGASSSGGGELEQREVEDYRPVTRFLYRATCPVPYFQWLEKIS